jgi:AcrR family transcriptional regulator
MYRMVHLGMASSQARDRLLAAAVEHAMREGIADLSLRELAAAIGTSHRMLIYHFGSREGLLAAVVRSVEKDQLAALQTAQDVRLLWERLSDPAMWPAERLFFEVYAGALLGRPGTEGFARSVVEPSIAAIAAFLTAAGHDSATASAEARLGLAVTRGLLLDLLATGDRDGVAAAYELHLQHAGFSHVPGGDGGGGS